MENKNKNNYAFIDSQNLNLSIQSMGWRLDFQKFRRYLADKYHITKAFLFIGFVEGNNVLYAKLHSAGFICIFKPTLKYKDGKIKGNCDAELVLQAMIELKNFHKAMIISGDGDFYCLANYLIDQNKLSALLIPNQKQFSALLKFRNFRP